MPAGERQTMQRLREIEDAAQQAREQAQVYLEIVGEQLRYDTDMCLIVALFTQGPVKARANLRNGNERLSGLLRWNGNKAFTFYDPHDPLVRQRFSLGHELGHFYLHPHGQNTEYNRCSQRQVQEEPAPVENISTEELTSDQEWQMEWEANAFSGAFLVPHKELEADMTRFGHATAFLAQRYGVSEAVVRHRIKTVRLLG